MREIKSIGCSHARRSTKKSFFEIVDFILSLKCDEYTWFLEDPQISNIINVKDIKLKICRISGENNNEQRTDIHKRMDISDRAKSTFHLNDHFSFTKRKEITLFCTWMNVKIATLRNNQKFHFHLNRYIRFKWMVQFEWIFLRSVFTKQKYKEMHACCPLNWWMSVFKWLHSDKLQAKSPFWAQLLWPSHGKPLLFFFGHISYGMHSTLNKLLISKKSVWMKQEGRHSFMQCCSLNCFTVKQQ